MSSFVLTKSADGQFRFQLIAGENITILSSEPFDAKASAQKGIDFVKNNVLNETFFERRTAPDLHPYFVLTAEDGHVLANSPMYTREPAREGGIKTVKSVASSAEVVDKTI